MFLVNVGLAARVCGPGDVSACGWFYEGELLLVFSNGWVVVVACTLSDWGVKCVKAAFGVLDNVLVTGLSGFARGRAVCGVRQERGAGW
jgi:hypothetical protein